MEKDVIIYQAKDGREPYTQWLYSLRDKVLKNRIETREDRIRFGNYGDHKRFLGIIELRLDFGKGYRIYCAEDGDKVVVLLIGGDKGSQYKDIQRALEYWRDYNEYKKI